MPVFFKMLHDFVVIDTNCINFDECQDYRSIARGSDKYVIASIAKTYKIQGETRANFQILGFTVFYIIDTDFDACRDYRRHPAGSPGAPREPSEAI